MFLQIVVVTFPPIAKIFDVVPLTSKQWILTLFISVLPIVIIESKKKLHELLFGKRIYNIYGKTA